MVNHLNAITAKLRPVKFDCIYFDSDILISTVECLDRPMISHVTFHMTLVSLSKCIGHLKGSCIL